MVTIVLITIAFSAILAFVLGTALGFFREKFKVERDPKIDEVREALPGANCGGCGFPGCDGYAEAVATGRAPTTKCTAGGSATAEAVSKSWVLTLPARMLCQYCFARGQRMWQCPRASMSGFRPAGRRSFPPEASRLAPGDARALATASMSANLTRLRWAKMACRM